VLRPELGAKGRQQKYSDKSTGLPALAGERELLSFCHDGTPLAERPHVTHYGFLKSTRKVLQDTLV
jgi:hypothetical protein